MLRKLALKDAERMFAWMQDDEVLKGLQSEIFKNKTLQDCIEFIRESNRKSNNCHMAIVDENDMYQGTVSLKMIDLEHKDAEFAIVLRRDAQGRGYAKQSMKEIMRIAFEMYRLEEVYWNVLRRNEKAIRLYDREGYKVMEKVSERYLRRAPKTSAGDMEDVLFYHITKEDFFAEI